MTHNLDVFFFCTDLARDPCAANVFHVLERLPGVVAAGGEFDGFPILSARRDDGCEALFVRTRDVVSNDYARYAGQLTERFGQARLAVVVNWHEGAKAPDRVLTFHSTGDVVAGIYAPTIPSLFSGYIRALERERVRGGLDIYRTLVEATHWSGIVYGGSAKQILDFPLPIYDMEIGSSPACWSDPEACAALARTCVIGPEQSADCPVILFCGGIHFEENVTKAVLSEQVHAGHVLPNHWLEASDDSEVDAAAKLGACVASYVEAPHLLVVHKGLASRLRHQCLAFGDGAGMSGISHKQMRAMPSVLPRLTS
jgi:D-tyrosyl-tRNA(Tyr) deacylase